MLRVFTDNHDFTLALNNLALFANLFDRRSDFHSEYLLLKIKNLLLVSYFDRHVMRPRVRSYGDISTVTLSPGRMRMKFIRSLPEIWAKIW